MSADEINLTELREEIEQKFSTLDTLARLGWGVLITGFAGGVWITTIQLAINNHDKVLNEARTDRTEQMLAIKALEVKDSGDTQLLKSIVDKLDRIDRKLNP